MEALFKPSVEVPSRLTAKVACETVLVWLKLIANLHMTKKTISDCLISSSSNLVMLPAHKMSLCRVDRSESVEILSLVQVLTEVATRAMPLKR